MDADEFSFARARNLLANSGFTYEYLERADHQGSGPKMAPETTDGQPGYPWRPYYMTPDIIDDLTPTKKDGLRSILNVPGFIISRNTAVMEISAPNQLVVFALDAMHDPLTPESDQTRVAKRLQEIFEAAVYVHEHEPIGKSQKTDWIGEIFRTMVHKRLKEIDEKHWLANWKSFYVGRILVRYGSSVVIPEPQACRDNPTFHNTWLAAKRWVDAVTPNAPIARDAQDTSNAAAVESADKLQSASNPPDGSASSRKAVHPQADFSDPNAEEPFHCFCKHEQCAHGEVCHCPDGGPCIFAPPADAEVWMWMRM